MSELQFTQQAAPGSIPPSGSNLFYFGLDGSPKYMNSSGIETTFATATTNLTFLGSTVLTVAAPQTSIVTLTSAMTKLFIQYNITGYSGNDIAMFRFGGTAGAVDTGNNYWSRHITWAAGGTVANNTQVTNTSGIRVAGNAVVQGRSGICQLMNYQTVSKPMTIHTQTLTGATGTAGLVDLGGGEWVNTTQQIISIQMVDQNGTNLTVGSGFVVWGAQI